MRKIALLIVLACLSAGCAPLQPSGCHKTTALGSCLSGRFTDADKYGRQAAAIKTALQSQLTDRDTWKGKKCRLHMDFARNGKLKNIEIREGNKAFCAALKAAGERATFSPFTDEAVYDAFASVRIVMLGE